MLDSSKNDPREALANAAPLAVGRQMLGKVEKLLEERIVATGNVGCISGMSKRG